MDPSAAKHVVEHVHITEKEKQIAQDMISKGYMVKKDCRKLEGIKKQTFYEVQLPSGRIDALGNVGSCTKYQLGKIEGTNVYLGQLKPSVEYFKDICTLQVSFYLRGLQNT